MSDPHNHDHPVQGEDNALSKAYGVDRGRLVEGALLLGIGVYLANLVASGDVGNYVNVRFSWLALVGGALSIILGGHALVVALRIWQSPSDGVDHHFGHTHASQGVARLALVAVPLVLGVLVPSQPLGAGAVGGDVSFGSVSPQGATVASADSLQWSVLDWLRALSYGTSTERLNGKPADVLGFVYRRDGDPPGHFILSRFLMVHCTADAYAVGVPVVWERADSLVVDTWVRVHGTVQIGLFGGNVLPIVHAQTIDEGVGRPSQVYLYQ